MASGVQSIPNLSAFSPGELSAMLTAVKAEILTRLTGRVSSGNSTQQGFVVTMYTTDELNRLLNALTAALGLDAQETRVRPCFSQQGFGSDTGALIDGRTTL